MHKSGISALSGAGVFVAGIAVPLLIPTAPSWVGWTLLGLSAVLFAVALGLWLAGRSQHGEGATTWLKSEGAHSPNFAGTFHGPVTVNTGLSGEGKSRGAPSGWTATPKADVGLREAFGYIIGGEWGKDFTEVSPDKYDDLSVPWQQIMQSAYDDRINIWGLREPGGKIYLDIDPQFWATHEIVYPSITDRRGPYTATTAASVYNHNYSDLHVDRAQIERKWRQ